MTLNHMGSLARTVGDLDAGRAHLRAALDLRRELGEKRAILMSTMSLGVLEVSLGDVARRAASSWAEAFARASGRRRQAGDGRRPHETAGLAEERRGELERAEPLLDAGRELWSVQLLRRFEGWAQIALLGCARADSARAGAPSGRSMPAREAPPRQRGRCGGERTRRQRRR